MLRASSERSFESKYRGDSGIPEAKCQYELKLPKVRRGKGKLRLQKELLLLTVDENKLDSRRDNLYEGD
jgi:hypothetical protein